MTTKTDIMNSYQVTFVFDYSTVSTCVFSMSEDAAIDIATDMILEDLRISLELMDTAQDIVVELLDENVL